MQKFIIAELVPTYVTLSLLTFLAFLVASQCEECNKTGNMFDWKRKDDMYTSGQSRYTNEWYVIDCRLSGSTTNVSLWIGDSNAPKKKVVPDQNKVTEFNQIFNITKLTHDDEGSYYCRACLRKDKKLGNLQISTDGKGFQTPKILNTLAFKNISYGNSLMLVCEVFGWYQMFWYKNGIVQDISGKIGYWRSVTRISTAYLEIRRFTEDDEGLYTCEARRNMVKWNAIDTISLKIRKGGFSLLRPQIITKPEPNFETAGKNITLVCKSNGSVTMIWRNEKIRNLTSRDATLKKHVTTKVLKILNFSKQDEGIYECFVRTRRWNHSTICNITMKGRFDWKKTDDISVPRYPGEWYVVDCQLKDGTTKVSLWKGDKGPEKKVDADQHKVTESNQTYNITNITSSDEGNYYCKAQYRKDKLLGHLYVKSDGKGYQKPKILKKPAHKNVLYGSKLQMDCEVTGSDYEMNWYKNGRDLQKSYKEVYPRKDGTHIMNILRERLTIEKFAEDDVALYTCEAKRKDVGWKGTDNIYITIRKDVLDSRLVYLVVIFVISALVFIFLVIVVVVLYRRKKLYGGFHVLTAPPPIDYIAKLDETKSLMEQYNKLPYISDWEFPRERVHIVKNIGRGTFGCLWLAEVVGLSEFQPRKMMEEKSNSTRLSILRRERNPYLYCTLKSRAAVKMLNDNWNESDLSDLLTELKLLIHIGQHKNVVRILGACTKGARDQTWIIMEYCEYGNLCQFLQDRKPFFDNEWLPFSEDQNISLNYSDLSAISLQVVFGMEFLVSRKCIHRDLAARNVLIGNGFVPKIADFGLARNVYKDYQFIKKTSGLLPVKWMSIEAMRDMIFSEKSDVWSFGILLWEMFSMGESPYKGIPALEIYEYLCKGNRMAPPVFCPHEIYDIMFSCWKAEPEERPSFEILDEKLTKLLMNQNHPWLFPFELDETEVSV